MIPSTSYASQNKDTLSQYLQEIGKVKLLTADEEKELARQIEAGSTEAKNRMIEANLRLVVCIARRYLYRGVALADLIEEGNLGLMHAVEKFNPDHGARFSTYGTWWIRQSIERAIMNQYKMVRLPVHVAKRYRQYIKARQKLIQKLDREPSAQEISTEMDISVESLQKLISYDRHEISLDVPINEDKDVYVLDTIADQNSVDPVDDIYTDYLKEKLESWLQTLNARDLEIIEKRYGLNNSPVFTLDTLGENNNLTRERVRQIQLKIIKHLKRCSLQGGIDSDDLFDYSWVE